MVIPLVAVIASAYAELTPLENTDLEEVWASAGIMFTPKNIQIFHHIDSIRYSAPLDAGYIEFQDFEMGGDGDVAKFNYDFGSVTKSGIMTFDVAEIEVAPPVYDWSGYAFGTSDTIHRGMTLLNVPDWDQELSYSIGNISLFDPNYPTAGTAAPVDLGSFYIGLIDMPRFYYYTSVPINGTGFDFQYNFQMTIDKIAYGYNDNCDKLEIGPTYIGGSFKNDSGGDDYVDASGNTVTDNPADPSSWKPNNNSTDFGEFQIGDLFGDIVAGTYSNPASINAGESACLDIDPTDGVDVLGALQLTLPMEGSIRFENASFYGTDFGPGAIDGIQVHRLNLFLIP
ncbi:MAG: hypothetical protein PF482_13070 [Desulfobacteraceae bacterium]|nr:hypothetical protein [Desulfobacteraceae bacterium]